MLDPIRRAEASDRSGGFNSPCSSHNLPVTSLAVGTANLEVVLDLLDHLGVLGIGQRLQAGIHGEGSAPLELALVLGHQVEVQVAAAVAVGTVVDLVGMEGLVDGIGSLSHIGEEGVALLIGDVDQLGNMVVVSHDDAAGMALLLEQDQLRNAQITDLDAEAGQDVAAHAVAAVAVFH